jgi:hypothetical protein
MIHSSTCEHDIWYIQGSQHISNANYYLFMTVTSQQPTPFTCNALELVVVKWVKSTDIRQVTLDF